MKERKGQRKSRQKSPEGKKIFTRLLVLSLFFWGVVTACGSTKVSTGPEIQELPTTSSFENLYVEQNTIAPEVAFLALVTGYKPEQLAAITNPNHRDMFSAILYYNEESSGISRLPTIGVSDCSDSRVCLPRFFKNITSQPTVLGDLPDPISGQTLTVSRIGAQPSLFPVDVTESVFIPHCSGLGIPGGCGALGGVEVLVNSEEGVAKLIHHGVSQMTIDEIRNLISMGAGATPDEIATIEQAWAKTGARMQAEINHAQYLRLNPGAADRTYYAGYTVYGHTDSTVTEVMKVIDNNGVIYSVDDFPRLKAYADYINVPHPVIESLMTQAPDIIAINGSRLHDTNKLFGELAQKPGVLFKSSVNMTPGVPISVEEARQVVAGADYSVGALKNSKFMVLVADNAADMAVLRTTLMTEGLENGSMRAFLEQGGIIVEMYPDEAGRFTGLANIVTAQDLSADLTKLNILTSSRVASTVAIENSFLGQIEKRALRDLELKVINEAQFLKIQSALRSVRPFVPFFKFGADAAATYFTVRDVGTWIDESVMGHSLIWDNPADRTVWNFNNPIIYTEDQSRIRAENYGAHPYLIEGRLDHIDVLQDDLVQAYSGAMRAYIERGPGMPNAADPWDKMESSADVGKLLTLEILPPYGPADGQPLKLVTTLVMKPNDENFDGIDVIYDNTDPNQRMMLVDQMTGLPIFGDISGQNTIVVAFDPSNPEVRYLFEVSVPLTNPQDPNSVDRKFVFKFVGVAPAQKEQSNSQNFDNEFDQILQELSASPGMSVGNFGIPVGPDTVFGRNAADNTLAFLSEINKLFDGA